MCLKFATYFKTQCNAFMCKLVFCYFVQSLTLPNIFSLKSYRILTTVHYASGNQPSRPRTSSDVPNI